MNILILSAGTRNKIVQYFRNELQGTGKVFTTDCSNLAPALYDSDEHFIVSRIDAKGYLDEILTICKENRIDGVLSLIDPELSLLAAHYDQFKAIGTTPIISNSALVELCFDKYKFHQYLLAHGYASIPTYIEKDSFYKDLTTGKISFPVFIKPIKGSASININRVTTKDELELLFARFDDLMIQAYMDGTEIGIDVYVDLLSQEPVSIFTKEKIVMRAGETDKSRSFKDPALFDLIEQFVKQAGFSGMLDLDVFKVNEVYYISEVNPRFGGGYLHAHEASVNFVRMIIQNLKGKTNSHSIGNYQENTYMMKYNEVKFLEQMS